MTSSWLVLGLAVVLFTPINLLILLYFTSFALFLHKLVLATLPQDLSYRIMHAPFVALANLYVFIGRVWHGHSVVGLENIPKTGPALLVFYHAPLPVDMYFLNAHIITKLFRRSRFVGDRFLLSVPGFGALLEALHISALNPSEMSQVLKDGHLVGVSPGGLREALFSDEKYSLVWNNRVGFAKVWLENCSAPIIPIFTKNGREAFRPIFAKWFRALYERTRLPIIPMIGGFPVKLTTIVGKPVEIPANIREVKQENAAVAARIVAEATAKSLEKLIKENQRFPPSIVAALCDRFTCYE